MSEEKPNRRGRPSIEDLAGEPTIEIKALITRSMVEYIDDRPGFSRAGFIRYLIRASMMMRERVASGEYDIDALPAGDFLQEVDKWNRRFEEIFGLEIPDEE